MDRKIDRQIGRKCALLANKLNNTTKREKKTHTHIHKCVPFVYFECGVVFQDKREKKKRGKNKNRRKKPKSGLE